VAHTCNPSYSEGKDQEDEVQSQPGKIVRETISRKHPSQKKGWWSGSRCKPSVQTPVLQKKKFQEFSRVGAPS
jgi:hypothetical protein